MKLNILSSSVWFQKTCCKFILISWQLSGFQEGGWHSTSIFDTITLLHLLFTWQKIFSQLQGL